MTDINDLLNQSYVRVKLVAFVHFIFITNAMIGSWNHSGYMFYNFLFMTALYWAMHCKDSIEAAQTALVVNVCSIFFDIINIITFFNRINPWAMIFVIINLILRPLSVILLYREFVSRGGSIQSSSVFPTSQQRTYQDIDQPTEPTPTNSHPGQNVRSIF